MRSSPTFLVADDEAASRQLTARMLRRGFPGASVAEASNPAKILEMACGLQPQLIVLDWVFPGGKTGLNVCRQLKSHPSTRRIPLLLISGLRTRLRDQCEGIGKGADLFVAKPFTREALCARVQALLDKFSARRPAVPYGVGPLKLLRDRQGGWWGELRLPALRPKLFGVLWLLAKRSPDPVSSRDLVRYVWRNRVKDKHCALAIARLRRKLRPCRGLRIESVPRLGYRLRTT